MPVRLLRVLEEAEVSLRESYDGVEIDGGEQRAIEAVGTRRNPRKNTEVATMQSMCTLHASGPVPPGTSYR